MCFINNVRRKVKHKVNKWKQDKILEVCWNKQLCAGEINHAETYWIRTIQANSFASEIQFLWNGNQSRPRRVEQFMLFLDEKRILRCRSRINNSSLPQTSKNPILLPSSHPYVDLLIRHTHELVKHSAVTNMLTTLRQSFWILKGHQAVKRVLKHCVTCWKLEGLPYSSYNSPDLPSFWVSDNPPFTHTGLDFAGPLRLVSIWSQTIADRGSQKVLRSSAIIWKHTSAIVIAEDRTMFYLLRSSVINCDRAIIWKPKFCDLRSKCIPYFEFRLMIQRFFARKQPLICCKHGWRRTR